MLAMFGATSVLAPAAWAQGTQRSTRELSGSETNTAEVFHTLKQLGGKDDGLRQLQEELNRTTLSFTRRALERSVPMSSGPLQIPIAPARKKKNDLSSFDGWLSNPDSSLGSGLSSEDNLGFLDSDSKSKDGKDPRKPTWDQIYQKLKQDDANGSSLGSSVKATARQPDDIDDDRDLPSGIKENANKLKSSLAGSDFGASIFKPANLRGSFSDFFGIGATAPTPEQAKARKAFMDQYVTSVFGDQTPAAKIQALETAGPSPAAKGPGTSVFDTLPSTSRSDGFSPANSLTSTLKPATVPDVNVNVLNQWNPLYTEPKLELPKPPPLFSPPVEVPRRRFF
ncbi:MAG TPA: hypothetical protein VHI52_03425 [Verrucomicrobiae bacterium]|nr:hypothetical protein [Verrucomicrobiae bacterium]